jgi:hypothetical protein
MTERGHQLLERLLDAHEAVVRSGEEHPADRASIQREFSHSRHALVKHIEYLEAQAKTDG